MTIERYNQILWAILGTVLGLGMLVFSIWLVLNLGREAKQPTIILAKHNEPKPSQDLIFCEPIVIRGGNRQLLPVAVINVNDPDSEKAVFSLPQDYRYSSTRCALDQYGHSSRVFNVIVRDTQTSRQWLLLNRPAQIESLYMPSEKCKDGDGFVPCGIIQ